MLLLSAPLSNVILCSLAAGPRQLLDLQREADFPAQTTLRAQLKRLVEAGAVGKRRRNGFPGVLDYELTPAGVDLLLVADVLTGWLSRSPGGPLELGGGAAKTAIKALAEGWSTAMLRALVGSPLSLTELDRLIASLSYPSLERRLAMMRLAGLVETCSPNGRSTPYTVTGWAREGVAPLFSAAKWEQSHAVEPASISRSDVEAAFLLALPLLRLDACPTGLCRMAVELAGGRHQAGVLATVADGRVVACTTRLRGDAGAWVTGDATSWFEAIGGDDTTMLRLGGHLQLPRRLIAGLHDAYSTFVTTKSI